MAIKSYTSEDEEFVRFVRTTHTLKETAEISGLSENIVKRIMYSKGSNKVLELEKILLEQQKLIESQARAISRLEGKVFPCCSNHEDETPATKITKITFRGSNE
jgi:hypothetical protein